MAYELNINNKKQTIQGVHISNPNAFADLRLVVQAEWFEGWKPTKDNINELVNSFYHPTPEMEKEYNKVFNIDK